MQTGIDVLTRNTIRYGSENSWHTKFDYNGCDWEMEITVWTKWIYVVVAWCGALKKVRPKINGIAYIERWSDEWSTIQLHIRHRQVMKGIDGVKDGWRSEGNQNYYLQPAIHLIKSIHIAIRVFAHNLFEWRASERTRTSKRAWMPI